MQYANNLNQNDYRVVSFHNSTDFDFTPEMGCMYDGRAINGIKGAGVVSGETVMLPFHVGNQLATNLAKRVLNTTPSATVDAQGIPTGVAVWDEAKLEEEKMKYMKDMYTEEKAVPQIETDRLMSKVEEYKSMVETLLAKDGVQTTDSPVITGEFQDKQEVMEELEKRGIKHDKRKTKEELEKLLA